MTVDELIRVLTVLRGEGDSGSLQVVIPDRGDHHNSRPMRAVSKLDLARRELMVPPGRYVRIE